MLSPPLRVFPLVLILITFSLTACVDAGEQTQNGEEKMNHPVTVIAPIKLAAGKTEADLLAASKQFQKDFVDGEAGILRRELVRTGEGTYIDIVQFSSLKEAKAVIAREMESAACRAFFSVMDESDSSADAEIEYFPSLETYARQR